MDVHVQRGDRVEFVDSKDDGEYLRWCVDFVAREDEVDLDVGGECPLGASEPHQQKGGDDRKEERKSHRSGAFVLNSDKIGGRPRWTLALKVGSWSA